MKRFKTLAAIVLSTVMILGSTVTAFAGDPEPINGEDSSTAGTGQILDFKVVRQVVPTALKVAINPNGYKVNLRYKKLTTNEDYSADEKYYKVTEGVYSVDTAVTSTNYADKVAAGLYVADTSESQIVTFNYGLANKSTVDRKITVKLDVAADEKIEFVDSVDAATAKTTGGNGTAERGEYKMYMAIVPAKVGTTPTTNTYAKATAFDANAVYYTRSDAGVYAEENVEDADAFAGGTFYVATNTIGTEIQASELGDISMENSSAPIGFAAGTATTYGDVAYALPKATWTLKDDEFIDFNTTQNDIASKFDMTTIGGITGFTITGAMNTGAEWSQLETKTITITPTYAIEDATGTEEAVATGLNQVVADSRVPAAPTAPTVSANTVVVGGSIDILLPEGVTISAIEKTKADGSFNTMPADKYTLEDITNGKRLTIDSGYLAQYAAGTTIKLTFSEGDPITITVTAE